ncbi:hypothetical protein [Verminephrobacter eiseniae]|uniref:hypothetical protein n=1 Tax=Verminephrobacter eiseniae TaxID=364317 RepID=UPI0022389CCE|nr:hypothetical protein [Verminephrobacter eiseniae]
MATTDTTPTPPPATNPNLSVTIVIDDIPTSRRMLNGNRIMFGNDRTTTVTFTFTESIDPNSFTLADLHLVEGTNADMFTLSDLRATAGSNNTVWTATLTVKDYNGGALAGAGYGRVGLWMNNVKDASGRAGEWGSGQKVSTYVQIDNIGPSIVSATFPDETPPSPPTPSPPPPPSPSARPPPSPSLSTRTPVTQAIGSPGRKT